MCGVWMREEIGERSNKYEGLGGCRVDILVIGMLVGLTSRVLPKDDCWYVM